MSGLRALRQLQFDHLHLRIARIGGETFLAESAVVVAAPEIAAADFPDQVPTVFAVIRRNRAFAGVVIETAALGAVVQRADRVRRQRPEAHRRDVEHARIVGLRGLRADADAEIIGRNLRRHHRMIDPFVLAAIDVLLGAERPCVVHRFGALVDQCPLLARIRHLGGVGFDEILAHLRTDRFQSVAEMGEDRIIAAQGTARLRHIPDTQRGEATEQRHAQDPDGAGKHEGECAQDGQCETGEQCGVARHATPCVCVRIECAPRRASDQWNSHPAAQRCDHRPVMPADPDCPVDFARDCPASMITGHFMQIDTNEACAQTTMPKSNA